MGSISICVQGSLCCLLYKLYKLDLRKFIKTTDELRSVTGVAPCINRFPTKRVIISRKPH